MSLLYSPAATATVAANTNNIAVSGLDLGAVLPGMVIYLGARDRVTGDGYIVASVTPTGSSGGTLTTVGGIPTAFTNAGFVIDTRDFNGTAPNYLIATYTQVLNALLRLTSPLTNLFTGSRQLALDKDSASAVSRLLYAIGGRTWGGLEQRTVTYTPTGAAQVSTEILSLRAYPDGTSPVDAVTVDLATGGADLRKTSATMAAAATVDLGSAPVGKVALTGSATIVSFGAGRHLERLVHVVDGGATLTHNPASLVLPGGANLVTAAGDCFHATSDASGNWRVRSYTRASGKPVVGVGSAEISDASASGRAVLTGTAAAGATALGLGNRSTATFGALALQDTTTPAFGAGIVTQVSNQLMQIGLNDPSFGAADTSKPTGFLRFEGRGGDFFQFHAKSNGSVSGAVISFGAAGTGLFTGRVTVNGITSNSDVTAPSLTLGSISVVPDTSRITVRGGISLQDNLTPAMSAGVVAQASNSLVQFGINDGSFGGITDASRSGGYLRLDTRGGGVDLFQFYAKSTGSAAQVAFIGATGNANFNGRVTANGITSITDVTAASLVINGTARLGAYTTGTVPSGIVGTLIYVSNARKSGEAAGAGTGIIAYYSNNNWRRLSDDSVIAA